MSECPDTDCHDKVIRTEEETKHLGECVRLLKTTISKKASKKEIDDVRTTLESKMDWRAMIVVMGLLLLALGWLKMDTMAIVAKLDSMQVKTATHQTAAWTMDDGYAVAAEKETGK